MSNSFVGAREREEAAYGFSEMVEFLIYSHEVNLMKPDPKIYALTCERLKLSPETIVFVDDREENIVAAREFGMKGVLCKNAEQTIAELEQCLSMS